MFVSRISQPEDKEAPAMEKSLRHRIHASDDKAGLSDDADHSAD